MPTNFLPKKPLCRSAEPCVSTVWLATPETHPHPVPCSLWQPGAAASLQRFYFLERSVWRRPCKCMPPFGNSTWRLALRPLSETNKRSQSSRLGWEDDFDESSGRFWLIHGKGPNDESSTFLVFRSQHDGSPMQKSLMVMTKKMRRWKKWPKKD